MTESACPGCIVMRGSEQLKDENGNVQPTCGTTRFIEELFLVEQEDGTVEQLNYLLSDGTTINALESAHGEMEKIYYIINVLIPRQLVEMHEQNIVDRVKLHFNGDRNLSIEQFMSYLGFEKGNDEEMDVSSTLAV